tara:strand:+ start:8637 stop:9953 length:1317 start_codon:yes stop_codon:yes gene_type:complete
MGIYDKVDDKQKEIIIKFGEVVYTLLGLHEKTEKDIINMLNDTIDIKEKIKEAFTHGKNINIEEIDYYKFRITELEEKNKLMKIDIETPYIDNINELRQEIKHKEELLHQTILLNQENYDKGLNEGKNYNNLLVEEKNIQIKDKDELIELYRPKKYDNMKEKGDEVENIISDSLVRNIDRMAYIHDTSDIRGSGDRIIIFPDYKMMIECKNKGVIHKSDIEQFKDHYTNDMNSKKYEIALFISYNCEYILGKGSFKIEEYNGYIIGYLGLSSDICKDQKESMILYFLTLINDMFKQNTMDISINENLQDHLLKSILEVYNDILIIEKHELPLIESIQSKYEHKKNKLQEYIINFEENDIPIPLEIHSINGTELIFIDKLIKKIDKPDFIIPKQNWKKILIEEFNLDEFYQKFLNKKGITRDKIVERYNDINNKHKIID